ncbi:hypothetical protein ACRS6K_11625 [Bacillus cytotoxicus]|uniref:hypothetical protein n=1 Tax=Bacillus cytotoxicus TaxID=580165 RepID=UPI0015C4ED49|nr:hypothetical protein [Bacillus cytotoxicus]MDH2891213.1 hypothetical protein [Bacillus cytotoxicus]
MYLILNEVKLFSFSVDYTTGRDVTLTVPIYRYVIPIPLLDQKDVKVALRTDSVT